MLHGDRRKNPGQNQMNFKSNIQLQDAPEAEDFANFYTVQIS